MNRRKFILSAGMLTVGAAIAPNILAEAVEWSAPQELAMTVTCVTSIYAGPPFLTYGLVRMYAALNCLCGSGGWHVTADYKAHSMTWHVPEWLGDRHYDWLRSWCNNHRSAGEHWMLRRGSEPVRETHPYDWDSGWVDELPEIREALG